jgi:hypothetical protein
MRRLLSTAKTTLLPANHSLGSKKGLHSNERLDDNQDSMLPHPPEELAEVRALLARENEP